MNGKVTRSDINYNVIQDTMEIEITRLKQENARNVVITTFSNVLSYITSAQCDISPTTSDLEIVDDIVFVIKRTQSSDPGLTKRQTNILTGCYLVLNNVFFLRRNL